jgi:hypothetical protein
MKFVQIVICEILASNILLTRLSDSIHITSVICESLLKQKIYIIRIK